MCANLKMAKVWVLLAVMLSISLVSADVCSNLEKIMNCNECFRCGGHWCKDPNEEVHCFSFTGDSWCLEHGERASTGENYDEAGDLLDLKYGERTVLIGGNSAVQINYKAASEPSVKYTIVNTTQNNDLLINDYTRCSKGNCLTMIEASPKTTFCSTTGRTTETVVVKVSFEGLSEESTLKYKMPCACACSDTVEKQAAMCNGQGDLSCGVCTCYNGWTGPKCDKPVCEANRGDDQCNDLVNNLECSGNGYCGPCDSCICYTDREGSKYFDKKNFCADICMTINNCDLCLRDPTPGKCPYCPLFYQNFNESLLAERDELNRSVWVMCNETLPDGYHVEYVAMRDERSDTYFMILPSNITNAAIGGGGGNVTLPIMIAAMVAALVAAGTFVVYKFWKSRIPPVPLTDPMYTNIDAEDCTGENPLYKPPTSSFKNPTYGKW